MIIFFIGIKINFSAYLCVRLGALGAFYMNHNAMKTQFQA